MSSSGELAAIGICIEFPLTRGSPLILLPDTSEAAETSRILTGGGEGGCELRVDISADVSGLLVVTVDVVLVGLPS